MTEIAIINSVLEWRLANGESGVLALTMKHDIDAINDDQQGRKCSISLNIPVRGTLSIVLAAKQRGVISAAWSVIEDILKAGLYLSKKVLDQALAKVDE